MTTELKLTIDSSLGNLSLIRSFLKTYLSHVTTQEETILEIVTIIDELATNVVEHAYQYQPGDIIIEIHKEKNSFFLSVEDNGKGMTSHLSLKEVGGVGLILAESLSDSFEIEKKINGTIIKVKKLLKGETNVCLF